MTMVFNGVELEEVDFNGVDCEKVFFNGALVFEKAIGNMLTIGELSDGPNFKYHGYLSNYYEEDDKVGDLSDSNFEAIPCPVVAIYAHRWYGGTPARNHYEVAVIVAEGVYLNGLYRLTVGDWTGLLVGSWMELFWNDSGFIYELPLMTKADFDAFPKSGTHLVTIEYLGV